MNPSKIFVTLDHNEIMRPRAEKVERAVLEDDRFEMHASDSLPFDLQFLSESECPQCHGVPYPPERDEETGIWLNPICGLCTNHHGIVRKTMHIELKDFSEENGSDYLSSILNGHLYEQILAARERQEPVAVVVLGDDNDVGAAIRKAASHAQGSRGVDPDKLMEYFRMVEGFEANCIALNVPVWRLKTDPWRRMLLRVRKILQGGDLTSFIPHPAENERNEVGFSILCGKGIGVKKAKSVLSHYEICLVPKENGFKLHECPGIGEKLSENISNKFLISSTKDINSISN